MRELHMIVDMQYGSCGKGLLAGKLAYDLNPDTIAIAWSPNSGHTYIDQLGRKMVNCSLPNGIVAPGVKRVLIGPGSAIDPNRLWQELEEYAPEIEAGGIKVMVHENAAVVQRQHREAEAKYAFGIGSTMKGVGEAVIDKIRRDKSGMIIARDVLVGTPLESFVVSAAEYNDAVDAAELMIIEGSQGFSLSINQGFYPFTTSRDCTVHQLLSDCAIPHHQQQMKYNTRVHGVCRTYPIRVSNRYNEKGEMVGYSGPCYEDQREIEWKRLGIIAETTTVTKLPRRLFTWSHQQIADAVRMNGIDDVFLNFANYIEMDREPDMGLIDYMCSIEDTGAYVRWVGYGPGHDDVRTFNGGEVRK